MITRSYGDVLASSNKLYRIAAVITDGTKVAQSIGH